MTYSARSLLFVPGDRPDRFATALASGADAICLDLEDAVQPAAKDEARRQVTAFLASGQALDRVFVRIGALATEAGGQDVLALSQAALGDAGVMTAKTSDPEAAASVAKLVWPHAASARILALIEDAEGLRRAHEIARVPGVMGLALGPLDLAASLGATFDDQAMATIRLQLRLAAAEGGVGAWDGPWPDVADEAGLLKAAHAAAALGYAGKLCIHPKQVAPVHAAFAPTDAALAHARAILTAAAATDAGAFMHDGKMIDAPVIAAARQVAARAGAAKPS
jgi:citrate lyase beta subunit